MPRIRTGRGALKSTPSLGVQNDLRVQASGAYTTKPQLVVLENSATPDAICCSRCQGRGSCVQRWWPYGSLSFHGSLMRLFPLGASGGTPRQCSRTVFCPGQGQALAPDVFRGIDVCVGGEPTFRELYTKLHR